jgi:hypothetical protein
MSNRMTTIEISHRLKEFGVELYLDPATGRLRYRAPAGGLTPPLREKIVAVALEFEERAAIREYDGNMDRASAERLAAAEVLGDGAGTDPAGSKGDCP